MCVRRGSGMDRTLIGARVWKLLGWLTGVNMDPERVTIQPKVT